MGAPRPARVLVTCCNTFQNKGDAALTLALDGELRRLLPDAEVTYSLRAPRLAREELAGRRLIPQFVTRDTAPGARLAALAARLDPRLIPAVAVLQAQVLVRWIRAWAWVDGHSSRLAARMLPGALRTLVREVRAADCVVAAPGGYLLTVTAADVGWIHAAAPLIAAGALGVPLVLAAMTIGPIPDVQLPAARLAIGAADLVLLREGRSAPWVERIGVPASRVGMSADMAWLTEPAAELPEAATAALAAVPGDGPLVAFAVRDFGFPHAADPAAARDAYLDALAGAADRLVERRGIRPLFVSQVVAPPVTDTDVARQVMARMRHAATLVDVPLTAREASALYGRLDLLIGVRMHAGILAMAAGTPFVGIGYGIKHAGTMSDLGLGRYLTAIDGLDAAWLSEAAEAALDDAPALRATLATRVPELQARARAGSERIAALIGTATARAQARDRRS